MAEKETILTLRGMNWIENEQFEQFKKSWLEEHSGFGKNSMEFYYACAGWIMANVYEADLTKFTPGEVVAIFNATVVHSNAVRQDEIKNWPTSLAGALELQTTAKDAEKSTSNEEKNQTAQTA